MFTEKILQFPAVVWPKAAHVVNLFTSHFTTSYFHDVSKYHFDLVLPLRILDPFYVITEM